MTKSELARLFVRERNRFAKRYPRVRSAKLGVDTARHSPGSPCGFRDVAWADLRTQTVWVLTRALRWERARMLGILRHELGHLADAHPEKPGAEQRADDIAERVTGTKIRYDERDVQNTRRGTYPRPLYLHR